MSDSKVMPQDLNNLIGSVNALKNVHELLNEAQFPGFAHKRVQSAIDFVAELHKQSFENCKAHPRFEEFFPSKPTLVPQEPKGE